MREIAHFCKSSATNGEFSALEGMRTLKNGTVRFSKAEFQALHAALSLCQRLDDELGHQDSGIGGDAHVASRALEGLICRATPNVTLLYEYEPAR